MLNANSLNTVLKTKRRPPEAQRVLFALGWPVISDVRNQGKNGILKKIKKQAKYNV
jgi:hypothetical protein